MSGPLPILARLAGLELGVTDAIVRLEGLRGIAVDAVGGTFRDIGDDAQIIAAMADALAEEILLLQAIRERLQRVRRALQSPADSVLPDVDVREEAA